MTGSPREVAVWIVRVLREAGHEAYLAGGCVRDELLALSPQDYDVATDAPPDRIASLFRHTRGVGRAFGVMQVRRSGVTVEVATFRQEHGYSDRRRPDAVSFCDARSDAQRRDFTINALFIDPLAPEPGAPPGPGHDGAVRIRREGGEVIDFVGGLRDMEQRLIRAVGDPDARLNEDNLRALRAVRFASRLGFEIDGATADAVRRHASELAGVSRERIGDEIRRMMASPSRAAAAGLMESLGLDAPALTEPPRAGGPLAVLASLDPDATPTLALAAWTVDRLGRRDPAAEAHEAALRLRAALCLSNDERDRLHGALRGVGVLERQWGGMGVAARKRAAASPWFPDSLAIVSARSPDTGGKVRTEVDTLARTPSGLRPTPLITGDDLISAGLPPGPGFGGWLDQVYDAQLEGRVSTRQEALELALTLAGGR